VFTEDCKTGLLRIGKRPELFAGRQGEEQEATNFCGEKRRKKFGQKLLLSDVGAPGAWNE